MNVPVPKVSGLRFLRAVVLVEMVMILVLAVLVIVAFVSNGERSDQVEAESNARTDQINRERTRNSSAACRDGSSQNRAILAYLESLGGSERQIRDAAVFFPVLTDEACALRAREQVTP